MHHKEITHFFEHKVIRADPQMLIQQNTIEVAVANHLRMENVSQLTLSIFFGYFLVFFQSDQYLDFFVNRVFLDVTWLQHLPWKHFYLWIRFDCLLNNLTYFWQITWHCRILFVPHFLMCLCFASMLLITLCESYSSQVLKKLSIE